jgi:hypothetical protein
VNLPARRARGLLVDHDRRLAGITRRKKRQPPH